MFEVSHMFETGRKCKRELQNCLAQFSCSFVEGSTVTLLLCSYVFCALVLLWLSKLLNMWLIVASALIILSNFVVDAQIASVKEPNGNVA